MHAAAVEESITKDKVDNMYRDAFSPVIDPLIAYFYRTPAAAAALKPLIGKDSALVRHNRNISFPRLIPAHACVLWCFVVVSIQ